MKERQLNGRRTGLPDPDPGTQTRYPKQREPRSGAVVPPEESRHRRVRAGNLSLVRSVEPDALRAIAHRCVATLDLNEHGLFADLKDLIATVLAKQHMAASSDQMTAAMNAAVGMAEKRERARRSAARASFQPESYRDAAVSSPRQAGFACIGDVVKTWPCSHTPRCTGLLACLRRLNAVRRTA